MAGRFGASSGATDSSWEDGKDGSDGPGNAKAWFRRGSGKAWKSAKSFKAGKIQELTASERSQVLDLSTPENKIEQGQWREDEVFDEMSMQVGHAALWKTSTKARFGRAWYS